MTPIDWPDGKRFAFTVFDDSDFSTVENTKPVYDFLAAQGFRTTKSCWVRRPAAHETGNGPGMTAEDPEYLAWLRQLQEQGFEIGLHNVSWASSTRAQTLGGFAKFEECFGAPCRTLANHGNVRECIYWGHHRLTGVRRLIYNVLTRFRRVHSFDGHVESSPAFWGDLCKAKVQYVRNFTFRELNTLKACPWMPYHDPAKPLVNYWFASSEGAHAESFNRSIREENQDRLEEEGGACIMYTHFASGFWREGRLDDRFRSLMARLAAKDGWFVPVATLLGHILQQRGHLAIGRRQRAQLERKWLWHKMRVGPT